MKKVLVLTLVVLLSLSATAYAAKTELRWASVHTEDHLATQMMRRAIAAINEKAEGVHVTGFPNSVLGGSQDVVEGVQDGLVEMITEGPAQFAAWVPKAAQVEAPYLWKNVDHMLKALNGAYKETLNQLFSPLNVKLLGSFYYGTRQLTVNKPVHTLDDLKGLKIRVPQVDLYVKMIESWKAAATPMTLSELYMALQTGTVDGQENPLTTYESQKFYETNAKYIILTDHIICANMVFMNLDVWNKLSAHDQEVVASAIDEAIKWQGEQQLASEAKLTDELAKKGCTVITPDGTIKDATVPAIRPLIEDWDMLQALGD